MVRVMSDGFEGIAAVMNALGPGLVAWAVVILVLRAVLS